MPGEPHRASSHASEPDDNELRQMVAELISSQTTMTLATCAGNLSWSAPVYYAYYKGAFYFFSSPCSRHITEALSSGGTAASIHASGSSWRDIRGIQMQGTVELVESFLESAEALGRYLKRFPFAMDFFEKKSKFDLRGFSERFGVRLYCFRPQLLLYTDNSIRFGFRKMAAL
ncbi:MAG: hypothetical protein C4582_01455 [Desulfobacteraceae bacterium]|nr:MAG: hypothetical protein C4582_01455 [Desulfobacteraceae bacterium]